MRQEDFRLAVEKFLERSGMKPTAFGKYAARDRNFVFKLRSGKGCGLKKAERVIDFIEKNAALNLKIKEPMEGNHEATAEIAAQ